MNSKKKNADALREQFLQSCGEVSEGDGIDPRLVQKSRHHKTKTDRKARQLCKQVSRTLELVLNDCEDELVLSMSILNVNPAPDSSCLLVTVRYDGPTETEGQSIGLGELLTRLHQQTNRLRCEIARSISRKRVPNLTYSISIDDGYSLYDRNKMEDDQ